MQKLILSKRLYAQLKNVDFQENFISRGGLEKFALWIDVSEDGQPPNINLLQGVIECLDSLNIDEDNIRDSRIFDVIEMYAEGKDIPVNPVAQRIALKLKDKWDRQLQRGAIYADADEDEEQEEKSRFYEYQKGIQQFRQSFQQVRAFVIILYRKSPRPIPVKEKKARWKS